MDQRDNSVTLELSEALKEATKDVHRQAEDTEFMRSFQRGDVSLGEFKLVMSSLYLVYAALEEEIERNKEHPAFAPLYFPLELHRRDALQEDLEYFLGPQWRSRLIFPAATQRYVERLHHVGRREPELLVAHAYTRYLGDLSGGQVLKKIAQKALQLPPSGEGLSFFTFPLVTNATKFKQLYRSRINTLEVSEADKRRILEEAKTAFLLNVKVFEELQSLSAKQKENPTEDSPPIRQRLSNPARGETPARGDGGHTQRGSEHTSLVSRLGSWAVIGGFVFLAIVGLYIL